MGNITIFNHLKYITMTTKELNRDIKRLYKFTFKEEGRTEGDTEKIHKEFMRLYHTSWKLTLCSDDAKLAMISIGSTCRIIPLFRLVLNIEPSYASY